MRSPRPIKPPEDQLGFTLFEALVALFVLGLISVMVLGVISMEVRADMSLRGRIESEDGIVLAQTILRERMTDIRQIKDPRSSNDATQFTGRPDRVDFLAPIYEAEGPHALHRFSLRLDGRGNLVLYTMNERASAMAEAIEGAGWSPLPLLGNVNAIYLDYFGSDLTTGRDIWQSQWIDRGRVPKLIRLKLTFRSGDTRYWPVFIVKPGPMSRVPCRDDDGARNCGGKS